MFHSVVRIAVFLLGIVLMVAPPLVMYGIATALAEPDVDFSYGLLLPPVLFGLCLGSGPLFLGLPRVAQGALAPQIRIWAGTLAGLAILALLVATLSMIEGSIAPFLAVALLLECVAFSLFVWPAKRYSTIAGNTDAS